MRRDRRGQQTTGSPAAAPDELTPEEISAKLAEADQNASNFQFQKDLGIALYRYSAIKNDQRVLSEAARILERANALRADDVDVLVNLGNAYFDVGYVKKELASFEKARSFTPKLLL